MKQFISVQDAGDVNQLVQDALAVKQTANQQAHLGRGKTIGLLFLNPSLRTRMSTQRAAYNLGMNMMVVNLDKETWQMEFEDGAIMNSTKSEHIKEAAGVIAQYCDIVAIRCFPGLVAKDWDYDEMVLNSFLKYCKVPIVSLESATRHPLQSFADMITIAETKQAAKPKVVLTWAPHIRALPQAVPNSFSEWAIATGAEVVRLGVVQRALLKDQAVTLPGGKPVTERIQMQNLRLQFSEAGSHQLQVVVQEQQRQRSTVFDDDGAGAGHLIKVFADQVCIRAFQNNRITEITLPHTRT